MARPSVTLTFVTVVFGAEIPLLELQARSLAARLPRELVAAIVVIDNGWRAVSPRNRARLLRAYGPLAAQVEFLRIADIVDDLPATIGWRAQQIAKLMVARTVETSHYVLLDAKNHLIRAASLDDFIGPDSRAHGGSHPYSRHPLQPQLRNVLAYLGADETAIERAVEDFPPTATPFVMDTGLTRSLVAEIETDSGRSFAVEFEKNALTEFFLYSGWIQLRGPGLAAVYDGVAIPSPTVWPGARTSAGLERAISEAERDDAAFFAVHRTALARGDRALRDGTARFWVDRGLFPDLRSARGFIRRYRAAYYPALASKKAAERLAARR